MPNDTHPAAARKQIEWMRAAGPARRFGMVRSLSRSVIELSRRALRRSHPDAGESEIMLRWVELHYGADLARRMRARL